MTTDREQKARQRQRKRSTASLHSRPDWQRFRDISTLSQKAGYQAASTVLPENLRKQLNAEIQRNPSRSWGAALANLIAAGRA